MAVTAQGFLKPVNLMNIVKQAAIYGVMCVGVTIVMVSGGADLSVGGQVCCGGLFLAMLLTNFKIPIIPAIILSVIAVVLVGCINGALIAYLQVTPMVVTLCLMLILNGLAVVTTGGYPIYKMPSKFLVIGQGYLFGFLPVSVLFLIIAVIAGWFILTKTYFGRCIYALGGNKEAARLAGINIVKTRIISYALCSFFVSIASLMLLSRTDSAAPTAGSSYQFDCMTACVLGGVTFGGGSGSIVTSMIGVIIISMLGNGLLLLGFDSNLQGVIKGIILLMAIAVDAIQKIRNSEA